MRLSEPFICIHILRSTVSRFQDCFTVSIRKFVAKSSILEWLHFCSPPITHGIYRYCTLSSSSVQLLLQIASYMATVHGLLANDSLLTSTVLVDG
jgi:hypothetical protein